jgi:hypothetical protein
MAGRGAGPGDASSSPPTTAPGKRTAVDVEDVAQAAISGKGSGVALPSAVKEKAEAALGADLSNVRVHDDPLARASTAAMGARAFAYGNDVFLGPNETADDTELMVHELTHVVQQRGGTPTPRRKVEVGAPGNAAEAEADAVASGVVASKQSPLIIEPGQARDGQMTRHVFLVELERKVKATATAALGPEWNAAACPYIEQWFATHRSSSAVDLERMARRYSGVTVTAARDYLPPIGARLAVGIAKWKAGGDVSGDLSAAGLPGAASAAGASQAKVSAASGAARKLSIDGGSSPAQVASELGPGQSLDSTTSDRMGDAFGQSFDHVRVHTGPVAARKASEMGASAFTVGADVAFASGQYQPGTAIGDALLAHELAHVSQQRRAGEDPEAQHAPVGAESAAAERDADGATRSAVGRLADPTKTAARASASMDTGFQLQRCPSDTPVIANASVKGNWEGKRVAYQHAWSTDIGDVNLNIDATRTLGAPQQTESAALALVQTNGKSGAVTLEGGIYVAYQTDAMSNDSKKPARVDAPTCEPGVVALVTSTHAVYRPGTYDPGATGLQSTSDIKGKTAPGDPFQGYKDALNGGKALDTVDPKTLIPAFEAAMRDTALAALAESERGVKEKKPKFDKGLGGVPDAEVQLIRNTALELLPLQQKVDDAKMRREGAFSLMRVNGGGEMAMKMFEKSKLELATYGPQRNAVRQRYPMLARLSTHELDQFTKMTDEERVKKLGAELPGILSDIAKTRDNLLDGKIDLWESTEIVETTIQGLGLTSKEKREVIADKKKDHERGKTITTVIKALINIGLGIGGALIGGPFGAAMALGALTSDVVDAIHDTDEYFVKKAASNTDVDPNKSILDPESAPGWGWLIVSWAAVGLDVLDVKAAVKAIEVGQKSVSQAAEELAKLKAGTRGLPAEGELVLKLKTAAGELATGEVLTEINKAGVANRLGVGIEIDKSIAETEVRVGFKVDRETGKIEITGMRVGVKATLEDVLAHGTVLKLVRRYEGVTGKVRQLWDKLLSLGGKTPANVNPFPPGSLAYNSWLEVKKLPAMIDARATKYGPHLTKDAEAALRQDIEFLESELARHQKIVDQMILEAGEDFVAKAGDSTLKCTNELGYSLPDVSKKPPLGATDIASSAYYYRIDAGKPTLAKKANRPGQSLRPELGTDGKPTGKFVEGELSREQKALDLVARMDTPKQAAFNKLVEDIRKAEPGAKVVPIERIAATKRTLAAVTEEFGDKAFRPKLTKLLTQALEKKGMKSIDAAAAAKKAVDDLLGHEIMVVRGTEQLRAYGYRPRFISATGSVVEDDLHHMVPLYLGGDHTIANLVDIDPKLHDAVHELVESVKFSDGVTLAPWSIQNAKGLNFTEGAAILHADGTITYDTLATAAAP